MEAVRPRIGYADLERWPDDGRRYELYDGEVFVVPSPLPLHQIVAARIYDELRAHCRKHGGVLFFAPLDIVLTEHDVVQPDLLMFSRERTHLLRPDKPTRHPPDLAIEILSPGTALNDRGRKMQLLARHGVREYWLVEPSNGTIEVFRLISGRFVVACEASGSTSIRSPLLPALTIVPADLVRPLDE